MISAMIPSALDGRSRTGGDVERLAPTPVRPA